MDQNLGLWDFGLGLSDFIQNMCEDLLFDLYVEMFNFLKTVKSLDGIFERVSVYPDGGVKVNDNDIILLHL